MNVKDCDIYVSLTCPPEATLTEVAKILKKEKQRRIIVVENEMPIGIISTTDMNNRVVAEELAYSKTAKDIMTKEFHMICKMEDELNEVFKNMVKNKSFFAPVLKENKLFGIITYGEVCKALKKAL